MNFHSISSITISLLIIFNLSGQGTYTGNISLTTQQDVDVFGANNFSVVDGQLTISGNDITSLTSLNGLVQVTKDLRILNSSNLLQLSGLNNLVTIGPGAINNSYDGDFTIQNIGVSDLQGLTSLEVVSSKLIIKGNDNLTNINGVENLQAVHRQIEIENNDQLQHLNGLSGLVHMVGIDIVNNDNLISISGLSNTNSILTGRIIITYCELIDDLTGLDHITELQGELRLQILDTFSSLSYFSNLTFIGGGFRIISIPNLLNLNGFENLTETGGYFQLRYNDQLTDYCAVSNLVQIDPPSFGSYWVANNEYNPSLTDLITGNCTTNPTIRIAYPKEGDYYMSGSGVRLQFDLFLNILSDSEFSISYTSNNGGSWSDSGSFGFDEIHNGGYSYWDAPVVTEETDMRIKIESNINGYQLEVISPTFTILPENHSETSGLMPQGESILHFPLDGSIVKKGNFNLILNTLDGYIGFSSNFGSPSDEWFQTSSLAHLCLDSHSRDYERCGGSCDQLIRMPIDGVVIFSSDTSTTDDCGNNDNKEYGNQIVVQAIENPTMAIRFAHLKEVYYTMGDTVSADSIIASVGGSGTEKAHLHSSLYKNIYGFPAPYQNPGGNGLDQTPRIMDLLLTGNSLTGSLENPFPMDLCADLVDNFSAEFKFNVMGVSLLRKLSNNKDFSFVYPNPTTDFISIKPNIKVKNFTLYSSLGQKIRTVENSNYIDLSNIKPGKYFYRINHNRGVLNGKIIIQ